MQQQQVVQVPLPILLLVTSLTLHIFIPITRSKSTIEPCSSADSCTSLLYYILPYDSKLSEIAYRFQLNISDILGANKIDPKTLADEIYKARSPLKVPVSCSCVDGIRRYISKSYTVRPADTADSISEGFGGFASAEQIKSSNGINATNPLVSGQSLVIALPCTCFGNVNNGIPTIYMSYVVKTGDNMVTIATEFGTTTMGFEAINGHGQPLVDPGDILSIPISACSSANLNWYNESLIVANSSYALTASNCIKCVCRTQDLNLRCWPSGIAPTCYSYQLPCKDSDLLIGDSHRMQTLFGCKVTTCIYRGHNGGKIYRSLAYSWRAACSSGNQSYSHMASSPSPSPSFTNYISISPSPSPSSGTINSPIYSSTTKQNFDISTQPALLFLTHAAFFTISCLGFGASPVYVLVIFPFIVYATNIKDTANDTNESTVRDSSTMYRL